jgi:hypothetical protein
MNRKFLVALACSAGLLSTANALAEGPDPCAIDTKLHGDGTVELSNIGHTTKCDVSPAPRAAGPATPSAPASPPLPASPVAADSGHDNVTAAAPDSADAPSADQKDRREAYRDTMMAGAPGTTAANPAVTRRYKMLDKAAYQAKVLNGAAPAPDAGGPGSP